MNGERTSRSNIRDETPLSASPDRSNSRRRSKLSRFVRIVLVVVAVWLSGDFIYSRFVLYRLDRYEGGQLWNANGVRVGEDTFEVGSGETALLLVHGINFSPIAYRNFAPELAQLGFTCRAIRLPGFATHVRDYAHYTYPAWVEAIDREVKDLSAGHRLVFLVAHSLGAAVALRYLAERNSTIAGIVLVAPAIEVSNLRSPLLPTRFWHEFARRTLVFTRIVLSPFAYDMRDQEAAKTIPQLQFTPRGIVDQTFAMIDLNRGRAASFRIPLLMLLSPTDHVNDSPAAEKYFDDWGSADKKLVWQRRAGHMIPLDTDWQLAAQAIAEFVRAHSPPQ